MTLGEQQILSQVTSRFPDLGVIMLCPPQPQEFLLEAMRVGVREVVPTPINQNVLINAVERFQQRMMLAKTPMHESKIVAFIPCKGGSGATFLASNIAYNLASEENKRVILLDFNLQFGDASLFVHEASIDHYHCGCDPANPAAGWLISLFQLDSCAA